VDGETILREELFDVEAERTWRAVAAGFLLNNDRTTALAKLVNMLELHIHDDRRVVDQHVDHRTDYDTIARALIQAAGNLSLVKQRTPEQPLAA
jgi:hypothetical protein